jgi:hypothetical protein
MNSAKKAGPSTSDPGSKFKKKNLIVNLKADMLKTPSSSTSFSI